MKRHFFLGILSFFLTIFISVNACANQVLLNASKSNRDVIYKQLITDLEEAATLVAWPNETEMTSTTEMVNKAFVKGLRARLCLVASGYAQRGNSTSRSSDAGQQPHG